MTMIIDTQMTSSHRGIVEKDCPICMEMVELSPPMNCLVTECGHTFHTSCFLNNVLHNGFGCPYCRRALVDETHAIEVRRMEMERQQDEDEGAVDVLNQAFYEEGEGEGEGEDGEDYAGADTTGTNWLTGGDMDMGMDDGVAENPRPPTDFYATLRQFIVDEGIDEWQEGDRIWNRERRREERAFLGMRIMFHDLDADTSGEGEGEGFYRDSQWSDWMDSEADSDD